MSHCQYSDNADIMHHHTRYINDVGSMVGIFPDLILKNTFLYQAKWRMRKMMMRMAQRLTVLPFHIRWSLLQKAPAPLMVKPLELIWIMCTRSKSFKDGHQSNTPIIIVLNWTVIWDMLISKSSCAYCPSFSKLYCRVLNQIYLMYITCFSNIIHRRVSAQYLIGFYSSIVLNSRLTIYMHRYDKLYYYTINNGVFFRILSVG